MTKTRLSLYISEQGEELTTKTGEHWHFPLLGILGEFTRVFYQFLRQQEQDNRALLELESEAWEVLEKFTHAVMKDQLLPSGVKTYDLPYHIESVFVREFFSKDHEQDYVLFQFECMAIYTAVMVWLAPVHRFGGKSKYWTPKERFLNTTLQLFEDSELLRPYRNREKGTAWDSISRLDVFLHNFREEAFRFRTRQVEHEIWVVKHGKRKVLTHLYHADGLLPLVWTEILWAIENGHYAHFCEICGAAFRLTRPYDRKAYICPHKECQKARRVQNAGGEKAIREKNREAKRKSRERLKRGERLRKRGI